MLSHGGLDAPLHLRGLVSGVVAALIRNSLFVILPKLSELLVGPLRGIYTQNDRERQVPAVQRSDSADQRVVKGCVCGVAILLALNWLVVRGAGGVGGNLPTVTPQVIVILPLNLPVHQAKAAHDVPPGSSLQGCMYPALVVDNSHAHVGQVFCPPNRGIVVRRAGDDLLKGVVHAGSIGLLEWQSLAVWVNHAECLRQVGKVLLGQFNGGGHDLLDRLVFVKRYSPSRELPNIEVISYLGRLSQEFFQHPSVYAKKLP